MQERKNRELKRVKKRWIYRIQACCRGGRRPCTCSQPCQRLSGGETIRIHESNAIFKSYDSFSLQVETGECVADMSVGEILVIGRAQGTQIEWLMVLNSRSWNSPGLIVKGGLAGLLQDFFGTLWNYQWHCNIVGSCIIAYHDSWYHDILSLSMKSQIVFLKTICYDFGGIILFQLMHDTEYHQEEIFLPRSQSFLKRVGMSIRERPNRRPV